MIRSIAFRLSLLFGLVGLLLCALSGIALYQGLRHTLDRQLESDLRAKLEVVQNLVEKVQSVEQWGELRETLTMLTTTDGNTRFWISCKDPSLNYGKNFPSALHTPGDSRIKQWVLDDPQHPLRTLGKMQKPLVDHPEIHLVVGVSTTPIAETMHAFAVGLTIICLCGIVLVSGLGYWVARVGLHPVAQLSASAQALSASNRSQRLHLVPAVSELTPLVSSFNGALDRLESAYAQLEGFSADVAHELRTPIGNMLGATQVMLTRERSAADLRDVLQSNLEELERLRAIVNDMLFLARADQGEAAQTLRQTRLSDEVKKTVEFLAPLIDEKALTVQTDGDVEALVDQALFRRVMTNLLHNAIQYSSPGSDVRVTMRAGGEGAEIAVSNVGTQIAAEHLNRLFDSFYRIDSSRASGADSHGLGLAIVKAIAHMHGGTVFASSSEGINTFGMRI